MNKQLQQRIGQLIGKDYFKLEFGCEVILHCDDNIDFPVRKVYDTYNLFPGNISVTKYGIVVQNEIKEILGTEPTLQDVLLAIYSTFMEMTNNDGEKQRKMLSMISYYVTPDGGVLEPDYNLTKSLFNQTDEVKQQLLELLK